MSHFVSFLGEDAPDVERRLSNAPRCTFYVTSLRLSVTWPIMRNCHRANAWCSCSRRRSTRAIQRSTPPRANRFANFWLCSHRRYLPVPVAPAAVSLLYPQGVYTAPLPLFLRLTCFLLAPLVSSLLCSPRCCLHASHASSKPEIASFQQ